MNLARLRWKSLAAILVGLSVLTASASAYAADYTYDDLNRVTSVDKDGKQTTYTYDHGGNLLSVTSTSKPAVQKSNIVSGWTAYMTKGMKAQYETTTANVSNDTHVTYAPSVVENVYGDTSSTVAADVYEPSNSNLTAQLITLDAKRSGGANIYRDIPVQGSTSYTYEGWVKTDEMKDAVVQVIVNYYDGNKRLIRYDNLLNLRQNTGWTSYNAKLTAPSGAVKARVHLQIVLLKANGHAKAGFADRTFSKAGGSQ
ncbi:RHS repeat domain-containing protein [Paenibacillus sp. WLX1005]|uniref:RHS repeat domain-containing protein n=1 Tax=Paenibacillus sp. WLX1005 TaxID=3243766 RepID=UPI00398425E0